MPKVSVIIPVYGVEKYIERCVRSLFEQTLDDIEYLFIDDCTPDSSIDILKSVLEEYPYRKSQVIIHRMEKNSGQAIVREWGMLNASGDFVIHCDTDDWVNVAIYEKLYNKALNYNLDIVYCDYYRTDGYNSLLVSQKEQRSLMQGPLWNKLVKRSLYMDNDIIYPKKNKAEDGALMTQISFYGNNFGYVNEPLYYYYINPESICGQISENACLNKLSQEVENTNLKIEFLKRNGVFETYREDVLIWKYEARKNLFPIMSKRKYRKLWRMTYREINVQYIFSKKISLRDKLRFIIIYLGLYNRFF